MDGVAIGIVKKNWDKDYPGQLQIEYTLAEKGKGETKWIPATTFYSGSEYGAYFLPEVNTKVVLGFLYGDKNCPVVLGCQLGLDNQLQSETANEDNDKKRLSTKGGYQVLFDEKSGEEKFSLTDPKKENTILIDTKEGSLMVDVKTKLVVKVEGEVFLTLEKGAVTIEGDVTVKAKNLTIETEETTSFTGKNVEIKPSENAVLDPGKAVDVKGSDVTVGPSGIVELKGQDVKITPGKSIKLSAATVEAGGKSLELKADLSGTLEAGGCLQVKGKMLMLN